MKEPYIIYDDSYVRYLRRVETLKRKHNERLLEFATQLFDSIGYPEYRGCP